MNRDWGTGGHRVGTLVRIRERDRRQVVGCWMRGRLLVGDLAMAVAHAGDGFWHYQLVNHGYWPCGEKYGPYPGRIGYNLIAPSQFGAYVLGEPYEYQPNGREVHLLLAGESVPLDAEKAAEDAARVEKALR